MKTILFDLDGTLLPMDQKQFEEAYFTSLGRYMVPCGFEFESIRRNIWKGTYAMYANDGTRTNEQAFWETFDALTGRGSEEDQDLFLEYYRTDFNKTKEATGFTPEALKIVMDLKLAGYDVALATNPLFPEIATNARIRWAGLEPSDFLLVTTYENCSSCKPNPMYFQEVCAMLDVAPADCIMIGNDTTEDLAAAELGTDVFLVTDCLENKKEIDISDVPHGSWPELRQYLNLTD